MAPRKTRPLSLVTSLELNNPALLLSSSNTPPTECTPSTPRFHSTDHYDDDSHQFLPRPNHNRRKTYAGDLDGATRELVFEYEERIALLEARNSRISVELEATLDALNVEREERNIERRQSVIFTPPPSTPSSTGLALDAHITEQSDLLYERKLRVEILESLKKLRTQNTLLSRSLREQTDQSASLRSALDAEREEKAQLQQELDKFSQINFTLLEHNKLLVGRDSALHDDISSLIVKSQADDWMRSVLEDELRRVKKDDDHYDHHHHAHDQEDLLSQRRQSLAITLEDQGSLRAQLTASRDQLHITERRLNESEKKVHELSDKIASLQRNMSQCVDSSAQVLEVERELRVEVTERANSLEEENAQLRTEIQALKQNVGSINTAREVGSLLLQPSTILMDDPAPILAAPVPTPPASTRKVKFLGQHSPGRRVALKASGCPPTLAGPHPPALPSPSPAASSRSSSIDYPETPDSSSTLVAGNEVPNLIPHRQRPVPGYSFRSRPPPNLVSPSKPLVSPPSSPDVRPPSSRRGAAAGAGAGTVQAVPKSLSSPPSSSTSSPRRASPVILNTLTVPSLSPSRNNKQPSLLLSATLLARKISTPSFQTESLLKTGSTLFIDVTSSPSDKLLPSPEDNKQSAAELRRQKRQQQRASGLLSDIAHTFGALERVEEYVIV